VRPDGLARLDGPDVSVTFALERDRGTESRDRLAEKLERYLLIASGPLPPRSCSSASPEPSVSRAREFLRRPGLPVATTSLQRHLPDPLGPVWRPVDQDRRLRLIDMGRGGDPCVTA
jgi:hypothetical protein